MAPTQPETSLGFDFDTYESLNNISQFINEAVSLPFTHTSNKTVPSPTTGKHTHKAKPTYTKTSTKRIKKSRRPAPERKEYIPEAEPTMVDVVAGRGGRTNRHEGNRAYWIEVLKERDAYRACKPNDTRKNEIALKILNFVHQRGGRFLEADEENGGWYELTRKAALVKAKQALRDKHVPKWAAALACSAEPVIPECAQSTRVSSDHEMGEFLEGVTFFSIGGAAKPPSGLATEEHSLAKSLDATFDLFGETEANTSSFSGFWDAMFTEAMAPSSLGGTGAA